jgi:hypothetical protein
MAVSALGYRRDEGRAAPPVLRRAPRERRHRSWPARVPHSRYPAYQHIQQISPPIAPRRPQREPPTTGRSRSDLCDRDVGAQRRELKDGEVRVQILNLGRDVSHNNNNNNSSKQRVRFRTDKQLRLAAAAPGLQRAEHGERASATCPLRVEHIRLELSPGRQPAVGRRRRACGRGSSRSSSPQQRPAQLAPSWHVAWHSSNTTRGYCYAGERPPHGQVQWS